MQNILNCEEEKKMNGEWYYNFKSFKFQWRLVCQWQPLIIIFLQINGK